MLANRLKVPGEPIKSTSTRVGRTISFEPIVGLLMDGINWSFQQEFSPGM
jgi:hypothetical protein